MHTLIPILAIACPVVFAVGLRMLVRDIRAERSRARVVVLFGASGDNER